VYLGLEAKPNNVDWSNDQILTLQEEIKSLEQQLETDQSSINSLKNNLQLISQENLQLKQQYDEIQQKNDLLVKDNHHLSNELQNGMCIT
jgi:chromosome segregation ATPase